MLLVGCVCVCAVRAARNQFFLFWDQIKILQRWWPAAACRYVRTRTYGNGYLEMYSCEYRRPVDAEGASFSSEILPWMEMEMDLRSLNNQS